MGRATRHRKNCFFPSFVAHPLDRPNSRASPSNYHISMFLFKKIASRLLLVFASIEVIHKSRFGIFICVSITTAWPAARNVDDLFANSAFGPEPFYAVNGMLSQTIFNVEFHRNSLATCAKTLGLFTILRLFRERLNDGIRNERRLEIYAESCSRSTCIAEDKR